MFLPLLPRLKAEVLLETVVVLITLAILAVSAIRIFSFLNMNMVSRITKYQGEDRLPALEGTPVDPVTYLDDQSKLKLTDYTDTGDEIVSFLAEPRLQEAEILLAKRGKISNLILCYKLNQASSLAKDLSLHQGFCRREVYEKAYCQHEGCSKICVEWQPPYWEPSTPQDYISLVTGLLEESIKLTNNFVDYYSQAIALDQDVLDNPIKGSSYDPADKKNEANREDLAEIINSLKSQESDLDTNTLINGNPVNDFKGLNYILKYIDTYVCREDYEYSNWKPFNRVNSAPEGWFCRQSLTYGQYSWLYVHGDHARARQELDKLIQGEMLKVKGSPFLEELFIKNITGVNSLLKGEIDQTKAKNAYDLTNKMLEYQQAKENSSLADTINSLKDYLSLIIEEWNNKNPDLEIIKYYFELSKVEAWALDEVAEVHL
ncbi:MAG: hypothetical protein QMD94_02770 [Candidatus Omnitrophota bacterium]|nr:hypothetical protein [Candidatus Omnitrophota bacterium]